MENLPAIILSAAKRPDVISAVDSVYAELQAEIDQRRPRCDISGRCCRFEEYGHRLYVTTLELARFAADLKIAPRPDFDGTGCPFQIHSLCAVHTIRPFGCRIYFCDATSTDWQHDLYERLHARLRTLHDELDVPYFYIEWRAALNLSGLSDHTAV